MAVAHQIILMTGKKDRCLEERQAPMAKKKKAVLTAEKVQKGFDYFVKRTMAYIIEDVLRSYAGRMGRMREVNIDDFEDLAAPERTPDIEKIEVFLGSSPVLIENEKLAAGLGKLSEKHRRILECAFVLDMPNKAIGELLDLEAKTIRNYKSEAYAILRKYMEGMCDAKKEGV